MSRIRRFTAPAVFLGCLAVLTAVNRCTFKKPVTPSWDVRFELPLIDTTYTMHKLADENPEQLSIDQAGDAIVLNIDKGPEIFTVGKFLTAGAVSNPDRYDFTGIGTIGSVRTIRDTLVLQNTILVQHAEFESGRVEFAFNNQTGFTMRYEVSIPSLIRNHAAVFVVFPSVPPGASFESIDLANVQFEPIVAPDRTNRVPYTGTMSILSGFSTGSNTVNVDVRLKDVSYTSATGWLNRTIVPIDTTVETGIKVSDVFRGIQVNSALLQMTLENEIRFPAEFDLTLTGTAEDGRTVTVPVPPQSVGANQSMVTNSVDFAPIANLLPKTLRLQGIALIGASFEGTPATILKDDRVKATIHFEAPLIFTLQSTTNKSEVDTIKIEKDAREKIQKNILEAMLIFEVENHVPLGFRLDAYFSNTRGDSTIFDDAPNHQLVRSLFIQQPAEISGSPGTVRRVSVSMDTLGLSKSRHDLDVFDSPNVFFGLRFTFPGTAGMVKVRPEDYIRVRVRIEATINTDFEKDDQEKGGGS
jgi:hypothetical protein